MSEKQATSNHSLVVKPRFTFFFVWFGAFQSCVKLFPGASTTEELTEFHQLSGKPGAVKCLLGLKVPAHLAQRTWDILQINGPVLKKRASVLQKNQSG